MCERRVVDGGPMRNPLQEQEKLPGWGRLAIGRRQARMLL
jgi:hypothetical protein